MLPIMFDNFYHYHCSNLPLIMDAYNDAILVRYGNYVKEKCLPDETIAYIEKLADEFFLTYSRHDFDKEIIHEMEEEFDSAICYMLDNPIHKEMEGIDWKIVFFGDDYTSGVTLQDMDNPDHKIQFKLTNWEIMEDRED